jgi:hypothetical protein
MTSAAANCSSDGQSRALDGHLFRAGCGIRIRAGWSVEVDLPF